VEHLKASDAEPHDDPDPHKKAEYGYRTHQGEKSDQDPHGSEKLDTYPHQFDADLQYCIRVF
jgi:hypothetical protein